LIELPEHAHLGLSAQRAQERVHRARGRAVTARLGLGALHRVDQGARRVVRAERGLDRGERIEEAVCAESQAMLVRIRGVRTARKMVEQDQPEVRARAGHEVRLTCVVVGLARAGDQAR
jgi:hypothetical protein